MKQSNKRINFVFVNNFVFVFIMLLLSTDCYAGFFSWLKKSTFTTVKSQGQLFAPGDICNTLPTSSVGGNVWEDHNFNGVRDETSPLGVSGITVNVYGCDGVLLGSPTTNSDGDWNLDVSAAPSCNGCTEVRVEYSNIPSNAGLTMAGADNGSSVQIVAPGTCTGLGINYYDSCPIPFDYTTPLGDLFPLSKSLIGPGVMLVTCGVFEDVPINDRYAIGLMDIRNLTPDNNRTQVIPPMYHHPSWKIDSIGNTFGLEYDTLGNMYVAASSHFGSGFGFSGDKAIIKYGEIGGGPNDLNAAGTVYKLDGQTGQASVFTVLPQLQFTYQQTSCEGSEFDNRSTGVGLGNLVYDKFRDQFFVSNFEDGKIYRVNSDGNIIDSFDPQTHGTFAADNGAAGPSPDPKPYGMAISPDGSQLFFGTSELDLTPNLYSIAISSSGAFSGTEFHHGEYLGEGTVGGGYTSGPWISISDLEFLPNGNLMIGMRTGCNNSYFNSHNHGGTFYIVEAADPDGKYDDVVANPDIQYNNDQTGNDDGYGGIGIWNKHDGTWDYALTSSDIKAEPGPHGIIVFPSDYTETGNGTTQYTLRPATAISYFGSLSVNDIKGVGGDAAVFSGCPVNITEIGNKTWIDTNEDGIQDACEPALAGVEVALYDVNGVLVATTITDANGEYYFNEDGGTNQTWVTSGDRVMPDSSYYIVFGSSQFSNNALTLNGMLYELTTANTSSGLNSDAIDSDVAVASGLTGGLAALNGLPIISIQTERGGTVNHTFDMGVHPIYDWGDLPDATAGTGAGNYETQDANGGPSHQIIDGLYLGATVDGESDGQQSILANGDDADEDGLGITSGMVVTRGSTINIPFSATNSTGSTAHVEMWIDWNGDGILDNSEKIIDLDDGSSAFPTSISVTVPNDAVQVQKLGVRIRLSNTDNMTAYGPIPFGEVEDYLIEVECISPVITSTDTDGCSFETLAALTSNDVGATWSIISTIGSTISSGGVVTLGNNTGVTTIQDTVLLTNICSDTIFLSVLPNPNLVSVGNPASICTGETQDITSIITGYASLNNPEWREGSTSGALVTTPTTVSPSSTTTYYLIETNTNGCKDTINVTVIVNALPTAMVTGTDPTCPGNSNDANSDGTIAITGFTTEKYDMNLGTSYSGTATYATATSIPVNGVIENTIPNPVGSIDYTIRLFNSFDCYVDQTVTINEVTCLIYDWGDLPDATAGTGAGNYETDDANGGPSHSIIDGLYLGAGVDNENDGQQSTLANGDGTDEDGLGILPSMQLVPNGTLNIPLSVTNTTGNTAHVEMWIDWNGDGDFDDAGEMVANLDDGSSAFPNFVNMVIPEGATQNQNLGVRVRLSNEDNMTPYGVVNSGEVEDYIIQITCGVDRCLTITSQ